MVIGDLIKGGADPGLEEARIHLVSGQRGRALGGDRDPGILVGVDGGRTETKEIQLLAERGLGSVLEIILMRRQCRANLLLGLLVPGVR